MMPSSVKDFIKNRQCQHQSGDAIFDMKEMTHRTPNQKPEDIRVF